MSLVLSNKGKGMQSSSEQPLVGEERYVTTRITAAKETTHKRLVTTFFIVSKMSKTSCFKSGHFINIYIINRTLHGPLGIRILSSALEDKIRIPAPPCNILYENKRDASVKHTLGCLWYMLQKIRRH